MMPTQEASRFASALGADLHAWVRQGFAPRHNELDGSFETNRRWQGVVAAGTELWLDSGDLEAARKLWTREFRALTTNNTLLNKEVQRGQYDELVRRTATRIRELEPAIPQSLLVLEVAFVLNAYHGLRLVETFDALVSVEEHTDLAHDIELAVLYGKRYHAICPERFIVKLPLTPEGLLAMRRLRRVGVPVNFTLGFSARQNYLAARLGDPTFVNVFLGRLNAFVADSGLGSGDGVGDKATAASQEAMEELRGTHQARTRQIAASMRDGGQVWTLAGTDVMTIPLQVAQEYRDAARAPVTARGPRSAEIEPGVDPDAAGALRFNCLWEVPAAFRSAVDAVLRQDVDAMRGPDLVAALRRNGVTDLFPDYSQRDIETFRADGKIPKLANWRARLEAGSTALDSLFNMSGLYSFANDQKQLDDRVRGLLH